MRADPPALRAERAPTGSAAAARQARLRAAPRDARRSRSCWRAVDVVEGDLARVPELPADLDLVVHCAGEVSFDPPIDEGFATNLGGLREVLRAVHEAAGAHRPPSCRHALRARLHRLRRGAARRAGRRGRASRTAVDWKAEEAAALRVRQNAARTPPAPRRRSPSSTRRRRRRRPRRAARRLGRGRAAAPEVGTRAAGRRRPRAGPQPRLDRLLHLHQGARRALPRGARRRAAGQRRPPVDHRERARPAVPGLDRGLQDGRADHPRVRPRRAARLPRARPTAIIDIIPVDLVVNAIIAAAATPPAAGRAARTTRSAPARRNPLLFQDLYRHRARLLRPQAAGSSAAAARSRRPRVELRRRGPHREPAGARREGARARRPRRSGRCPAPAAAARDRPRPRPGRRQAAVPAPLPGPLQVLHPGRADLRRHQHRRAARLARRRRTRHEFGFDPAGYDWAGYLRAALRQRHRPVLRDLSATPGGRRSRCCAPTCPAGDGRQLAVFDLDGTLVSSTVVESYLWLRLAGAPRGRIPRELAEPRPARPGLAPRRARRPRPADPRGLHAATPAPTSRSWPSSSTTRSATSCSPASVSGGAAPACAPTAPPGTAPCCSPARVDLLVRPLAAAVRRGRRRRARGRRRRPLHRPARHRRRSSARPGPPGCASPPRASAPTCAESLAYADSTVRPADAAGRRAAGGGQPGPAARPLRPRGRSGRRSAGRSPPASSDSPSPAPAPPPRWPTPPTDRWRRPMTRPPTPASAPSQLVPLGAALRRRRRALPLGPALRRRCGRCRPAALGRSRDSAAPLRLVDGAPPGAADRRRLGPRPAAADRHLRLGPRDRHRPLVVLLLVADLAAVRARATRSSATCSTTSTPRAGALPAGTRVVLAPVLDCAARGLPPCAGCAGGPADALRPRHLRPPRPRPADRLLRRHRRRLERRAASPTAASCSRSRTTCRTRSPCSIEPLACAVHAARRAEVLPGRARAGRRGRRHRPADPAGAARAHPGRRDAGRRQAPQAAATSRAASARTRCIAPARRSSAPSAGRPGRCSSTPSAARRTCWAASTSRSSAPAAGSTPRCGSPAPAAGSSCPACRRRARPDPALVPRAVARRRLRRRSGGLHHRARPRRRRNHVSCCANASAASYPLEPLARRARPRAVRRSARHRPRRLRQLKRQLERPCSSEGSRP